MIKMAESKGALIAKSVQKHAGRAKEKLLQNLGKVDRTLDDIFEEHLQNFNRQHQQATRLQKEFNNYIRCIRAAQTASKSLMEAISEVYESGWSGHDLLYMQAQNMEMLWQDFSHKLGDQVLIPLNTYTNQFPETRKKIEKRGRKLVDYDSQRHSFQNLQANAAKRRDDVKVTRGREQLEEAKRTYEVLNSELHDELPALHDSRVLFYVNNLQTLFAAEQLFHAESAKVYNELEVITDKLANECQRGSYNKRNNNHVSAVTAVTAVHNGQTTNNDTVPTTPATPATPSPGNVSPLSGVSAVTNGHKYDDTFEKCPKYDNDVMSNKDEKVDTKIEKEEPEKLDEVESTDRVDNVGPVKVDRAEKTEKVQPLKVENATSDNDKAKPESPKEESAEKKAEKEKGDDKDKKVEELYDIPSDKQSVQKMEIQNEKKTNQEVYDVPVGATLSGLPSGVLYRVRATYRYTREDDDELSFDVGDIINVVLYDDPEEQEEGWLMGVKETTNEKGMFPANFTRPI